MSENQRDVVIRIVGKNITEAEFAAVRGTLGGIQKEAEAAGGSLGTMWAGMKGAAGLVGVTFGVGAVVGFAGKVVDAASAIGDMAARYDISAEAAQRFKYAAEQGDATLDDVGKAIGFASKALADGDKSFVGALAQTGLNLADLRQKRPEDMFRAIAEGVRGIEDPFVRANAAADLFGKGPAAALMPAIRDGIVEVGNQTSVMADQTVENLKRASDNWQAFYNALVTASGNALGAIAGAGATQANYNLRVRAALEESVLRTGKSFDAEAERVANMSKVQRDEFLKSIETVAWYADVYDAKLSPAQKKYFDELNRSLRPTQEQVEAQTKAAAAAQKHAEELKTLADVWTGKDLNKKIVDMASALSLAEKQGGLTAHQSKLLGKELDGLIQQGGTLPPKLSDIWRQYATMEFNAKSYTTASIPLTKALKDQTDATIGAKPELMAFNDEMERLVQLARDGVGPTTIGAIKDLGKEVKLLPPPPIDGWKDFKDNAKGYLDGLKLNVSDTVVDMIGHWSEHKNKAEALMGSLDTAWRGIMAGFLDHWQNVFIKKLVSSFSDAGPQMAANLTSSVVAAGTSATSAASLAGAAGGSAWASQFLSGAAMVASTAAPILFLYYMGGGNAPRNSPQYTHVPGTPVSGPEARFEDPNTGRVYDQGGAYSGPDPGNPVSWDQGDSGASGGDNGVNSFAVGSRGLRTFREAGEMVRLHGREEVLTANQSQGVASMVAGVLNEHRRTAPSTGAAVQQPLTVPPLVVNLYLDRHLLGKVVVDNIIETLRYDRTSAANLAFMIDPTMPYPYRRS